MDLDITSYLLGKNSSGGGTTINNQDKTITENGEYTADSGYTGLGTVTVNVPSSAIVHPNYVSFSGYPDSTIDLSWLRTDNITNMNKMFEGCKSYSIDISLFDTSNVTTMQNFFNSSYVRTIDFTGLDTSKVEQFNGAFANCSLLTTISLVDMSGVNNITSLVSSSSNITTLGGFKDLGKGYPNNAATHSNTRTLDLSSCTSLTHESAMKVINNLFDLATAGKNRQYIKFSTSVKNSLTAEEQAIATNKGWDFN